MPKQVQFTKETIIGEAVEIIRNDGAESLTARSLSKRLGCSVAPIFRTCGSMEQLTAEVRSAATSIIYGKLADVVCYEPAFKEFGMRLLMFSREEPNLFRFIFLDKNGCGESVDSLARKCLTQVENNFGIAEEQSLYIYGHIWTYLCGLAQLCSRNPEVYTDECISKSLSIQMQALLALIKTGREVKDVEPHLIPEGRYVYLRKWRESDAPALYKYASDPDVGPRAGWPPHQSVEESLDVIRKVFSNSTVWAIVNKETREIVGCVGYLLAGTSNIPLGEDEAEVGYWVAKPFWDQGICTEALELMITHCRSLGTFSTLYGDCFTDNPASARVMEKCGFKDTGETITCSSLLVGADKEVRVLKLSLK